METKGRQFKEKAILEAERVGKIITLPNSADQKDWLQAKLGKYLEKKARAENVMPEFVRLKRNDYKISLLEAVLNAGRVDIDTLASALKAKEGSTYDADKFASAAATITKYCQVDTEHLYEGSSLVFAQ